MSTVSGPSVPTSRASSRSARAGTFASSGWASGVSSSVCLTESRYESVATIVSFPPSAWTSTPVRIGRTSSRDAARATRSIVSASGAGGQGRRLSLDLGQAREVLGRQRLQVKASIAGGQLDVALLGAQLERHLAGGQAAGDVDEKPARKQHAPRRARS